MKLLSDKSLATSSRRKFLKRGAVAASALTVPYFVPPSALGQPGRPGANGRVLVGMIGCGARANHWIRYMPADAQVVAICDCNTRKMDGFLEFFDHPKWATYQDFRTMIDHQQMDEGLVPTVDRRASLPVFSPAKRGSMCTLRSR